MFFDLAKSLRYLTRSPIHSVIHEAHRFARHHLENGGNVTPHSTIGDQDFVLPPDVSASAVASAIEDRLRNQRFSSRKRSNGATPALKTNADGRAVVPADVLLLLGDGAIDSGRRVLERIVSEVRHHRMLSRLPMRPLVSTRR
jgi:hypothetical protein